MKCRIVVSHIKCGVLFFGVQRKSTNNASSSGWSETQCQTSTDSKLRLFFQLSLAPISFEQFQRPWQTVRPESDAFNCAGISIRRAWNTTKRQHGLGPNRMENYPLLAIRKPVPTVAEDRPDTRDPLGLERGRYTEDYSISRSRSTSSFTNRCNR